MKKFLFLFAALLLAGCHDTTVVVQPPQPLNDSASGSLPPGVEAFSQPGYTPPGGGGGAATSIGGLPITITSPQDGEVLQLDSGTWVNGPDQLQDDVDVSGYGSATPGQALVRAVSGFEFADVAGGVTIKTPDGLTTVPTVRVFDPKEYGAAYLDTSQFTTSSTTTSTATFDDTANTVTFAGAHGLTDGDGICFTTTGTLPTLASGSWDANTRVYVDVQSSTVVTLHTTRAASIAGTGDMDFTSTGSGTPTGRLKTTFTINDAAGSAFAAGNDYEAGQYAMAYGAGPTTSVATPDTTVDGVTASLGTKVGTDPTFTVTDATNVLDLSANVPLTTGDEVWVSNSGGALPTGLSASTGYFVRGPIETQTVVIAGTPTGGTYTVTYNGNTTAAIAYNADQATFQAALRLLAGLSQVEVTTTGSSPNYTHTVLMVGTSSVTPQMTSNAASLTGGTPTITHDTTDDGRDLWQLYDSSVNAIATGSTGEKDIDAGTGTHTMEGRTAHYAGWRVTGGEGDWTAALQIGPVYHFNYVAQGYSTFGIKWTGHLPIGSRGGAWYIGGSSGRKLGTVMDGTGVRGGTTATYDEVDSFSSAQTAAAGAETRFNGSTLSAVVGEIIEINSTSGTNYDGQHAVTVGSAGGSNFTLAVAFGATSAGLISRGQTDWIDYGSVNTLQAIKGMPAVENRRWGRMNSVVCPVGTNIVDTTNDRLWQVYDGVLSNRTDFMLRSGSSTPSWSSSTDANSVVTDGKLTLKRAIHFVPLEDTSGAVRKAYRSKVQSKTSTTIVMQDAVFADIGSNTLALCHDDTMALRNTFAAMRTYDKSATLQLSVGTMPIYPPKVGTVDPDGVTWWTATGTSNTLYALYVFGDADPLQNYNVVAHPNFTLRVRPFETKQRIVDRTLTNGQPTIFSLSCPRFRWHGGGRIIHHDWAGGLSEHDDATSYEPGLCSFTNLNTNSGYQNCYDIEFEGLEHYGPQFSNWTGTTDGQKWWVSCRTRLENCVIGHGGGDGNANFFLGDFESRNNHYIAYRYLSSHNLYVNIGRRYYRSIGDTFLGVTTGGKSSIHAYGESNDDPVSEFMLVDAVIPFGEVLIGSGSSNNTTEKAIVANVRAEVIDLSEIRGLQMSNIFADLTLTQDCRNVQVRNLHGNLVANVLQGAHGLQVDGIVNCDQVWLDDVSGTRVKNIRWRNNPVESVSPLVSDTYSWVATGAGTNEYELRLRSTNGDPGIAQPTRLLLDNRTVVVDGTVGSLGLGQAGWGPSVDGYNTVHIRMQDTGHPDPDEYPIGFISSCAVQTKPLVLNRMSDTVISDFSFLATQSVGNNGFCGWVGTFTGALVSSSIENGIVEYYRNSDQSQQIAFDFNGAFERPLHNFTLRNIHIRQQGTTGNFRCRPILGLFRDNSTFTLERISSRYMTGIDAVSGWNIQGGRGRLIDCEIQDNKMLVVFDDATDQFTVVTRAQLEGLCSGAGSTTTFVMPTGSLAIDDAYNHMPVIIQHANGHIERTHITDYVGSTLTATVHDILEQAPTTTSYVFVGDSNQSLDLLTANGVPIRFWGETMPGGLTQGQVYWTHNTTQKAWTNKTDASSASASNFIDITTDMVVVAELVDLANDAYFTSNEPITGNVLSWVEESRGNKLRGSNSWTYAQLTGNVGDKQLQPTDVHLFTSNNDANLLSGVLGFGPPGTRKWLGCRADSTNDWTMDHAEAGAPGNTVFIENEFNSPTGADLVFDPGEIKTFIRSTAFDRIQVEGN